MYQECPYVSIVCIRHILSFYLVCISLMFLGPSDRGQFDAYSNALSALYGRDRFGGEHIAVHVFFLDGSGLAQQPPGYGRGFYCALKYAQGNQQDGEVTKSV